MLVPLNRLQSGDRIPKKSRLVLINEPKFFMHDYMDRIRNTIFFKDKENYAFLLGIGVYKQFKGHVCNCLHIYPFETETDTGHDVPTKMHSTVYLWTEEGTQRDEFAYLPEDLSRWTRHKDSDYYIVRYNDCWTEEKNKILTCFGIED